MKRPRYSPVSVFHTAISLYRRIPYLRIRVSTKGQSKKSPLYVTMMSGLVSLMWLRNRSSSARSSFSLKILNGPGYSGFGVYSKSLMSSETISRLMMRYPCPSIMYEIIIILSTSATGNLRGALVHSMSYARVLIRGRSSRAHVFSCTPCVPLTPLTKYHFPTRQPESIATRWSYRTSNSRMSTQQSRTESMRRAVSALTPPRPPISDSVNTPRPLSSRAAPPAAPPYSYVSLRSWSCLFLRMMGLSSRRTDMSSVTLLNDSLRNRTSIPDKWFKTPRSFFVTFSMSLMSPSKRRFRNASTSSR